MRNDSPSEEGADVEASEAPYFWRDLALTGLPCLVLGTLWYVYGPTVEIVLNMILAIGLFVFLRLKQRD